MQPSTQPTTSQYIDSFLVYVKRLPSNVGEIKEVMNDMETAVKKITQCKFDEIEAAYVDSFNKNFHSLKKSVMEMKPDSDNAPLPDRAKESFAALHHDVRKMQLLYSTTTFDLDNLFRDLLAGEPNAELILKQKHQLYKNDEHKSRILYEAAVNNISKFLGTKKDINPEKIRTVLNVLNVMNNSYAFYLFVSGVVGGKITEGVLKLAEESPDKLPSPEFLTCLKLAKDLADGPPAGWDGDSNEWRKICVQKPEVKDQWPKIEAQYPLFAEMVSKEYFP